MKKRIISTLLTLTLLLGLLPVVALHTYAEEVCTHVDADGDGQCDSCAECMGEHSYQDECYYSDENVHYKECDNCSYYDPSSMAEHVYSDNGDYSCNICDYSLCSHDGEYEYGDRFDSEKHMFVCEICKEDDTWEGHSDADNNRICDGCGYRYDTTDGYGNCLHLNKDKECFCVDCYQALHTYEDGYYHYEEEHHYDKCVDCGQYKNGSAHKDENSDCLCDVCGHTVHKFDELTDLGNGNHSGLCNKCGKTVTLQHNFCESAWDNERHWYVCACDAVKQDSAAYHMFENENFYYGIDKHYPECDDCSYYKENEGAAHVFGSDDVCTVCDAEKHVHDYISFHTENGYHYPQCDCGYYNEDGGEACKDEDGDDECDVCDTCIKHIFKAGYYHSEDGFHYSECDKCTYYDASTKAAHTDDNKDHRCDVCDDGINECTDDKHDHWCDYCGEMISFSGTCEICQRRAPSLAAKYTELNYEKTDTAVYVSGILEVTADANGTITAVWGKGRDLLTVTEKITANEPLSLKFGELMLAKLEECTLTFVPDDSETVVTAKMECSINESTVYVSVSARTKYMEDKDGHFGADFTINGAGGWSRYLLPGTKVTVKLELHHGDSYKIGQWTVDLNSYTDIFIDSETDFFYYALNGVEQRGSVTDDGAGTITFTLPNSGDIQVNLDILMEHDITKCVDGDNDHLCDSSICTGKVLSKFTDDDNDKVCDICGVGGVLAKNGEILCVLEDALSMGGTVKLLADHSETKNTFSMANLGEGVEATLDLCGFELSGTGAKYLFNAHENSKLKIIDSSEKKTGKMTNPDGMGIISLNRGAVDLSEYPDPTGITVFYLTEEQSSLILPENYSGVGDDGRFTVHPDDTHIFGKPIKVDDNTHKYTCICGEEKTEDHTYGEWTVTKEATETEKGSRTRACVCGHEATEEVPVIVSNTGETDGSNASDSPDPQAPTDGEGGLSGGVIAAIVIGTVAVLGGGGFAIFWFVIRKKK